MTCRRLLVASLLGSFTLACASSTPSSDAGAHPDASAAGGVAGGTAGQGGGGNGSGGATGNGGTRGTGGSAGAGGVTAGSGTGGSSSLDPTGVCVAAIQAQAERLSTCTGQAMESYLRATNACPDYLFNPDSNRTVPEVAACLPALRARTCTDVAAAVILSCYASGKRDGDAGCAFSSECKSGACNGGGVGCGVCSAGAKPAGSACQSWFECAAGLHCTSGGQCADNGTPTYAAEGQPCDLDATPIAGCVGDLYCEKTTGTCTGPPGAGQPCAANGMTNGMFSNAICAAGTTCVQGTCQPPGGCGSGLQCNSASYCASTGSGLACAPRALAGQGCSGGTAGQPCLSPAVCLHSVKCVVPRAEGEACDTDNPCDEYLSCVGGTCQKLTAAACPA